MAKEKKWYQYVGVRAALILFCGSIITTGMIILQNRSELKLENNKLKGEIKNKKNTISNQEQQLSQKTAEIQRLETQLTPFKTIALEKYTGTEQERLIKLSERIQELENPLKKSIASAEAQVEVTIKSDEDVSTRYMTEGGLLSFVKNRQPLLLASDIQSDAKQTGKGEVIYKGVFRMQADHSIVNKPIETLKTSDIIQIMFSKIPENSQVIKGNAVVVLNGDTRLEFEILPQQMRGKYIIIRDIKNKFLIKQSR